MLKNINHLIWKSNLAPIWITLHKLQVLNIILQSALAMSWLDSCIIMSRSIVRKHKRYWGNESLLSVSDNMAKTIWVDRSDWSFIFILTFFFRQGPLMTTGRSITDTQRTLLYTKFKEENDLYQLERVNPLFPRRLIDFF